jgi:hypothetical protein
MIKTMTASEVKVGQRIQIRYKHKDYVMVVEWICKSEDGCQVSFWGDYALSFIGASERVILIDEDNCEFWQKRHEGIGGL